MRISAFFVAVALLLIAASSPSVAAPYSRAEEVKKACSAQINQEYQRMRKQLGWSRPRFDAVVNGIIDRQAETPTENLLIGQKNYDPTKDVFCYNKQILAHRNGTAERKASSSATAGPPPPLRQTVIEDAHNPGGEASDCVRVIYAADFEVEHVSTTQKAAFRNRCSRPIEVTWCTMTDDCRPGYTNLATVPAKRDRGFSYEPSVHGSKVAFSACYNGFVRHQGELSKKLLHACK